MAYTTEEIKSSNMYGMAFNAFDSFPLDFSNIPFTYTQKNGKRRMCRFSLSGLDDQGQYTIVPTLYIYPQQSTSTSTSDDGFIGTGADKNPNDLSTWATKKIDASELLNGDTITFTGTDYDTPSFILLDIKILDENDSYVSFFSSVYDMPRIYVTRLKSKIGSFYLNRKGCTVTGDGSIGRIRFSDVNVSSDISGLISYPGPYLMSYAPSLFIIEDNLARHPKPGTDVVKITARGSSKGYESVVKDAIGDGTITVVTDDEEKTSVRKHVLSVSPKDKSVYDVYGINTSFWSSDSHTVVLDTLQEVPELDAEYGFDTSDNRSWIYEEGSSWVYGYVGETDATSGNTTIVLFDDWAPPIDGQDNITVKFRVSEDGIDTIDRCRFGTLFGTSNAKNRLFVSGNPSKKNVDWHTGETGTDGDFSYFPDTSYNVYGQDNTALVGYGMVSDGKLMAVKGQTDSESTIYYRTGTYTTVKDDYGNAVSANGEAVTTEAFPLTKTNSRIAGVKPELFADFCGDSLFVTPDGSIVGMDNEGTTYDNQRVASTRTHYIDSEIRKRSSSVRRSLYADGDRLYYSTDDGTYVSDYNLNRAKGAYHWFRTDVKGVMSHARYILNAMDSSVFGTYDGRLLAVDKGYVDRKYHYVDDARWDYYNRFITDSKTIADISGSTQAYLKNALVYVGNVTYIGGKVLVDYDHSVGSPSILWLEGTSEGKFYGYPLTDKKENADGSVSVSIFADGGLSEGKEYRAYVQKTGFFAITGIDTENQTVSVDATVVRETDTGFATTMSLTYMDTDVSAYYITAPMLTDYANSLKTVWSYTVIWDTRAEGSVTISKVTDEKTVNRLLIVTKTNKGSFDFEDMDLHGIDMRKKTLPDAYTSYRKFTGGFISLMFTDSGSGDSVLTEARFTYSYSSPYVGQAKN